MPLINPATREVHTERAYVLLMFHNIFKIFIFSGFCQTNYLNVHHTDLYEIYRDGSTLAVDKRSEVIFPSIKGRCRGNQFLLIISSHFFVTPDLRNGLL